MYNRFDASVHSDEKLTDRLLMFKNHTTALNDYAKLLEKVFFWYIGSLRTHKRTLRKVKLTNSIQKRDFLAES